MNESTEWCAGIVVFPKKLGKVRHCVNFKALNDNVLHEVHPIPKVDETLAQLAGAMVFSKLDANGGFWQIPLSKESRLRTTFVSPTGCYCFDKLPFGISSAPELFQNMMNRILEGLAGILCHMDDVLVFEATQEEHDLNLMVVLKQLDAADVTLNPARCEVSKTSIKFLGHLLDKNGINANLNKTEAVLHMDAPQSVTDLRRPLR